MAPTAFVVTIIITTNIFPLSCFHPFQKLYTDQNTHFISSVTVQAM